MSVYGAHYTRPCISIPLRVHVNGGAHLEGWGLLVVCGLACRYALVQCASCWSIVRSTRSPHATQRTCFTPPASSAASVGLSCASSALSSDVKAPRK